MADHGRHGIPDNLAYIDQADFDDLEEFDTTSDKGYDSCKGTPKRTLRKVRLLNWPFLYSGWLSCYDLVCTMVLEILILNT